MFEFHGWARVESTSGRRIWRDDGMSSPDDYALYPEVLSLVAQLPDRCRNMVHVSRSAYLVSITLSGMLNHRDESIFNLFKWLASNAQRSTGVLFARNVEDADRDYDYNSFFRVFRLSRGQFVELETLFEMPEIELGPSEVEPGHLGTDPE